ncbi:hypothetical protein SIID45300_00832 [Candidatus Magnetaquicoccaceae bacterium FCR-1]|uniref:Alpha-amylase n=1 Tax=Candidatus Magnetaquiglobus chichijimensis TaxID=3141448 RepID=A0ABQ0C6M2_9PROT
MGIAKRAWDRGLVVWMLLGLWMTTLPAQAATYDATGRWAIDFTPDALTTPLASGCLSLPKESILATLSQDGDAFTVRESAGAEASGSIDAELYTYHIQRPDGSGSQIALTLNTADAGSGTVTTSWPDGAGGTCSATGSIVARRAHDALFALTGDWTIQFGAEQLDTALSDPACTLAPARSFQARIDQDGNRFIATLDAGVQITGDIDRAVHVFADKQLLTQPHLSVSRFLMLNANQGSGTARWSRLQGGLACSGSNTLSLTRAGVTADPNAQLSIAPINLTEGQSRGVSLAHVTGTPSIVVEPESGVVALDTLGGVTTARCEGAGSATLTVTDATGSATASVNCVPPVTDSPVDQAWSQWIFLPGVTLVNGENWRGGEANSRDQRSIGWSRAGVATSFLNRGTVSSLVGNQGLLYTLGDDGLIFHGEKSFDSGSGQSRRRAYYGFVNAPSLESGAAGIGAEQLASANLKSPPTVLPGRIVPGTPVTTVRVEFELDDSDQPLANRWSVVEQTIEVTGSVNLLAAETPESLADDAFFPAWRDAITDLDLLGRLTSVVRLKVSESRYEPGQFLATGSSGELYLARGVGIVLERWNESDGKSHGVLMGLDRGSGLTGVTARGMSARQFRIEGPSGTTLVDPFVQVRVEHGETADHTHETIAWHNETPTGNQALLTLFELDTDDPADSTRVVRLSHGARGFETQVEADVDLGMLSSSASLPLSLDQVGHAVTFLVKDASGAVIGQAGVRVSPVREGQCAGHLGNTREVDSSGATVFTLANGPHCVDVWPRQNGAFAGGAYDATIPTGVINIVLSSSAPQGIPVTISDAITQVVLVVGPDDLPRYNRISGRVTDGIQGLAHAEILVYPSAGGTPYLFQADGTGAFGFDLPAGAYRFAFRHVNGETVTFGYLTAIDPGVPLSSTPGDAQYIHASALLGDIKLTAALRITTATLSGTLTDETSARLSEPVVVIARSTTSAVYQRVTASSTGAFALRLPVNQEYLVRVEGKSAGMLYRGYVDAFGNLVAGRESQSGLNLTGDRGLNGAINDLMGIPSFPVSGRVTDATTGQGVAGVTVRVTHAQLLDTVFETVTDAQGNYTLAVEAGSYRVAFFREGYIAGLAHGHGDTVVLGGESGAEIYTLGGSGLSALSLPVAMAARNSGGGDSTPQVTIRGDVTNTHGQSLANLLVELLPVWEQNSTPVAMASARSDGSGHYEVAIRPGFYRVYFRPVYLDQGSGKVVHVPGVMGAGGFADGLGQITGQEAEARVFEFTGDEQVNAMLPGGVRVAGLVSDAAGAGLKGVKVAFLPDSTQPNAPANGVETITDQDGRYEAFVVPNALWRIYLTTDYWDEQSQKPVKIAAVGGYATGAEDDGVSGSLAEAKAYTFAEESLLNVRLKSGVRIQGMVTAADGSGVADVLVRFQPEWDADANTMGGWGERTTDFSGHYEFDALPGKYRIEFLTRYWNPTTQQTVVVGEGRLIGGFADGQGGVTSDWSGARLVQVMAPVAVDARLGEGMSLSGHVANAEGKPAIGATVYAHLHDWSQAFHAQVDAQGDFAMIVSPGQTYQLEVWPAGCAAENTDPAQGCGEAFVPFTGGRWITQPDAGWVSGWSVNDPTSRPVVVASAAASVGPIPGVVMEQSDPHIVTGLRMDGPLQIGVLVEQAVEVHGRVVDDQDHGVANAWVSSDFGAGPTDGEGYFILHLPAGNTVTQAQSTFTIGIWPGGYEDPETHAWKSGDFVGGKVRCEPDATCRLTMDESQASAFGTDLVRGVPWPASDLGNDHNGLVVRISRGVTVVGEVMQDGQGIGNVWVHARSLDQGDGAGSSTNSLGAFTIRLPAPADGAEVWYEITAWSDGHLPPEPVLARVKGQGVVAVHAIDPSRSVGANGAYRPVPGESLLADDQGGVPVRFNLTSGNTISGRVTDAQNNGMSWTWVDVHTKDGGKWYGANTDENGNYRVTVAPANDYIAVVWGWSGQYRTTYYKNVGKEDAATLIDVSNGNREGVDIQMNSGARISGTIKGLTSGVKLWLNVWSESEGSWGGKEVVGTGQDVSYEVTGLAPAKDYRLDWRSESDEVPAGYYGGVVGGEVSGPKSWEKATLISTLNGNVVGVGIDLTRIQTKTLHVKVDGIPAGTKAVDVNLWSEKLESGRWKQTKVNAGQTEVSVDVKGLESSDDYRLFIGGPDALFKVGNFKGEVSGSGYPATGGSVVGWDRATLIDMSAERYVHVSLGSGRKLTVVVSGLPNGEKAWVDAFSESTWSWGGAELISTSDTASGQVEIKGLEEAGDYRISIWGAKIRGGSYAGENAEPDTWDKAKLVSVSGQDATVNMRVSSGRSIAGQVSGLQKGQWGWVDAWSSGSYSWSGNSVQAGGTGTDGYTLGGLGQASDFRVSFLSEGYVPRYVEGVDTTNGNVSGVNFAASTGGSISGSIRGLKAYEWARVDAWSPATGAFVVGGATADGSGAATYRLTGLPDGSDYVIGLWRGMQGLFYTTNGVTVSWDRHSPVTVSSGGAVSGIDFDLSNAANLFFTLSGAVSGVGETQVVEINAWSSTGGGRTSVTGNGTYKLEGLSAGTYTVEVMSPGYVTKRTRSVTVASGAVTEAAWTYGWNDVNGVSLQGNTTGLNVAMESGRAITGTVKVGSTSVSGAWVNAWSEGLATGGGAVTDAAGKYAIKGLPAGTYRVDVWTTEGTVGDTVTVGADADQVKDLSVVKSAGIIRGKVTSDGTTASVKALVLAYDASGVERDRAVSDSGGDYRLEGLEPNQSYTLKVFAATNGNWSTTGSGYATSCAVTASTDGANPVNPVLGSVCAP